jgi:hypothetical protein
VGVDLSKIDLSYVSQSIAREVKGIGKYVSVQRMQFETDNSNQLRVLVIIDDERAIPHTFQLPRAGDVIFEQSRGNWSETRSDKRNSKLSLELTLVGTNDIRLQLQGPCCSSMNATFAPYH